MTLFPRPPLAHLPMLHLRKRILLPTDDSSSSDDARSFRQHVYAKRAVSCAVLLCLAALLSCESSFVRRSSSRTPLLVRNPLEPTRDDELVDVVYVYANKTSPRVMEEYQKLSEATAATGNQGFKRSPPSKEANEDLDPMEISVRMTAAMSKNLGKIYIIVNFEEELSETIRSIPQVKVVLNSHFHEGVYFSSLVSESNAYRIPNLSRFYVNMNDDMLLTKPIDLKTFFFSPEGHPRMIHGIDKRIESFKHTSGRLRKTQKGGSRPSIKYTLGQLEQFVDTRGLAKLYPTHCPRPSHRQYVEYVQTLDPELFRSPYSTHFRCQQCLQTHLLPMLHSLEAGTLLEAKDHAILAYIDSPATWQKLMDKWDDLVSVTIQEVDPSMHKTVLDGLEAKLTALKSAAE